MTFAALSLILLFSMGLIVLTGIVVDCIWWKIWECRLTRNVQKAAEQSVCKDCGTYIEEKAFLHANQTKSFFPEHVGRCCDCADKAIG